LEAPYGIRLSTSLGFLPAAYVDVINELALSAGWYDSSTATLVSGALDDSLVWRTHLGWRPFADHGFYLDVGYGLVTLGGGISGGDLIASVSGFDAEAEALGKPYAIASTLHMLDAEIGWQIEVWEGLWIRPAIGFAGTVASNTEVTPDFETSNPAVARAAGNFARFASGWLDAIYTSYIFTPVVTLGVGWRFL
jgi:hypothetical protein